MISGMVASLPVLASPALASDDSYPRYLAYQVDKKSGALRLRVFSPGETVSVTVKDMDVDLDCAGHWFLGDRDRIRVSLIENGCARLHNGAGSKVEKKAQAEFDKAHRGGADGLGESETESPLESIARIAHSVSDWSVQNWQFLVGTVIGLLGLGWYARVRYNRHVTIVLAGAPSSGKTDFWIALKDGTAPQSNSQPSILSRPSKLEPLSYGKYTFYPTAVDVPGSEPGEVLDQATRSRWTIRWRRKFVLVVVAAPTARNMRTVGEPTSDPQFIDRQAGYMALPQALAGTKSKRSRPHLVLLFISKFDLVSQAGPYDPLGESQRHEVEMMFQNHRRDLAKPCELHSVPFKLIVGSAKLGWGIEQARRQLTSVVRP